MIIRSRSQLFQFSLFYSIVVACDPNGLYQDSGQNFDAQSHEQLYCSSSGFKAGSAPSVEDSFQKQYGVSYLTAPCYSVSGHTQQGCKGGGCAYLWNQNSGQLEYVEGTDKDDQIVRFILTQEQANKLQDMEDLYPDTDLGFSMESYTRDPWAGREYGLHVKGNVQSYSKRQDGGVVDVRASELNFSEYQSHDRPVFRFDQPEETGLKVNKSPFQMGQMEFTKPDLNSPNDSQEISEFDTSPKDFLDQTPDLPFNGEVMPPPNSYTGELEAAQGQTKTIDQDWKDSDLGKGLIKLQTGLEQGFGEITGKNRKRKAKAKRIQRKVEAGLQMKKVAESILSEIEASVDEIEALDRNSPESYDFSEVENIIRSREIDYDRNALPLIEQDVPEITDILASDELELSDKKPHDNDLPYQSESDWDTYGKKIARSRAYVEYVRNKITGLGNQKQNQLVEFANKALDAADRAHEDGDMEESEAYIAMALTVADIALGLTPGVSWGKDAYEAITGENMVTGEPLDTWDRTFAVIGVVTAGVGSKVGKASKVAGVVGDAIKVGDKGADAAKSVDRAKEVATFAEKSAKDFEHFISKLPAGERVGHVRGIAKIKASKFGWTRNNRLSKKNGGRDIFSDNKGNFWAVDTQHGHFEKLNSRGKHQGSYDLDLKEIPSKPADPSGGHDIIL